MAMFSADAAQVCSDDSHTSRWSLRAERASRPSTTSARSRITDAMPGMRYVSPQPLMPSASVSFT